MHTGHRPLQYNLTSHFLSLTLQLLVQRPLDTPLLHASSPHQPTPILHAHRLSVTPMYNPTHTQALQCTPQCIQAASHFIAHSVTPMHTPMRTGRLY
eukprot:477771-Pelagomonas_calceolata.AAC.1